MIAESLHSIEKKHRLTTVQLTENQMQNLIGQILYDCAEGGILNELGLSIATGKGKLTDIERNGYAEIALTIREFLSDIEQDKDMYNDYPLE